MEKPGIEPATPGLQGIALIHYTTGASNIWVKKTFCGFPWVVTSTAGRVYLHGWLVFHQVLLHGWLVYNFCKIKKDGIRLSLSYKTVTTNSMQNSVLL